LNQRIVQPLFLVPTEVVMLHRLIGLPGLKHKHFSFKQKKVARKVQAENFQRISARTDWVPLPGLRTRKFSGTGVCRVTFKHLPQPLRCYIRSFGTLGQLLKIPPFSANSAEGRGSLHFCWLKSFYFC
jgi:hypothetical protein